MAQYDVKIVVISERAFSVSVIDHLGACEYIGKDIKLKYIGVNTLFKALKNTQKEVSISIESQSV